MTTQGRLLPLTIAICALIFGLALRWNTAASRFLHDDEIWSLMLSTGRGSVHLRADEGQLLPSIPDTTSLTSSPSWTKIPATLSDVTHPPGFFLSLGIWRRIFGPSPLTARTYSILLAAGFLVLTYLAVRKLLSPSVALCILLPLALAKPFSDLSMEIRPYGFSLFAWSLMLFSLCHLKEANRRHRFFLLASLSLGTAMLTLSHYFASGAVFAMVLAIPLLLPSGQRRAPLLTILCTALLSSLIWLPGFLSQYQHGRFSLEDPATQFLKNTNFSLLTPFLNTCTSFSWLLISEDGTAWLILLPATALLVRLAYGKWRLDQSHLALLLLAAGGTLAPLTLDVLRHSNHTYIDRYLILLFPPLIILCASPVALVGSSFRGRFFACTATVGVLGAALLSQTPKFRSPTPDVEVTYIKLKSLAGENDPILTVADPDFAYPARKLFLELTHYLTSRQHELLHTARPLPLDTLGKLRGRQCILLAKPETRLVYTLLPDHNLSPPIRVDDLHCLWVATPRTPDSNQSTRHDR